MSVLTMLVPFSSAGQDNGGVKIDVPGRSVDPGEPIRLYLWGRSPEALAGYTLTHGAQPLGAGQLRQYPGQTEAAIFNLDGSTSLHAFAWPVLTLLGVEAVGALYHIEGNAVSVVALPGESVSRYFRLSGNALAVAVDAPRLLGTVRATAARSPHCREWTWIAPASAVQGLPAELCPADAETRDAEDFWFFLLRWGVLQEDFSLSLAPYNPGEDAEEDADKTIGVVFCIDTTGSMDDAISGVLDALGAFIAEVTYSRMAIQIGIITFGDEEPYRKKLPVTDNLETVSSFIETLEAEGGDDPPENQLSAIVSAATMMEKYKKRVVCLITDINYHVPGDGGNSDTTTTPDAVVASLAENAATLFVFCPETYWNDGLSVATAAPLDDRAGAPPPEVDSLPALYANIGGEWLGNLENIMVGLTNNFVRALEDL